MKYRGSRDHAELFTTEQTAALGQSRLHWGENNMLWTIFTILLILWLFGLVTSYTLGGFIHILLVLAIVVFAIRIIEGRRIA